ncbi:MAG: hypothetical protein HY924_14725 [Elusimicrobia bacterium]|nr:hypothetical protein [Elusimicrobiota bacterium]
MTRPAAFAFALSLTLVSSPAWPQAPAEQNDPIRVMASAFERHQVGQPSLDQTSAGTRDIVCKSGQEACKGFDATLLRAREVQKGCSAPCDSPSEVELYRAMIGLVCEDLRLEPCGKALENYIPAGVARKRPAEEASLESQRFEAEAVTALLSDPRLDPKLRTELGDKALKLAESLGRLNWVEGDGDSVMAFKNPLSRLNDALKGNPQPAAAGLKTGQVPIPAREVEARFTSGLNAQISRFPTGAAVLQAADPLPPVSFQRIPDENGNTTLAYYDNNKKKMVFNSERVAETIRNMDPATAKLGLEDVAKLKDYLARNPDVIAKLAGQFDVLYVHELTHRGQHLKDGDGLLSNTINGWKRILSGNKYPIEAEWEAFGNQNKYFHERSKKEPEIMDFRKSPQLGIFEYENYIKDLQGYRRSVASLYQDECDTADKLRFFKGLKPAYDQRLAAQARDWPQVSYDGHMSMARHWAGFAWPDMAFGYLASAHERASKSGFLAKAKPEMAAFFGETLKKLEAKLADQKPGAPVRNVRNPAGLLKLSKDLGVPLPPRVAALVK